jgi:RES domain-containing protein
VERGAIDAVVYRHVAPGYAPLSGDGARRHGGRWNPPDSFGVVYTALDVRTVDDELVRSAARSGIDPATLAPRRLFTIRVRLSRVLDLTDPSVRDRLGVAVDDLTSDDLTITRAIGEAANHIGIEAILAPSAAGPGQVLAVFLSNRAADSILEIVEVVDDHRPGHSRGRQPTG